MSVPEHCVVKASCFLVVSVQLLIAVRCSVCLFSFSCVQNFSWHHVGISDKGAGIAQSVVCWARCPA